MFVNDRNSLPVFLFLALAGCSADLSSSQKQNTPLSRKEERQTNFGKVLDDDFLLFGTGPKKSAPGTNIGTVNSFLWKGALDSVSFMPLSSADAVGGIIVTDWYISQDQPNERVKMTIQINDRQLRADALKVDVFKQTKAKNGNWVNVQADSETAVQMENIILSKARDLRVKSLNR